LQRWKIKKKGADFSAPFVIRCGGDQYPVPPFEVGLGRLRTLEIPWADGFKSPSRHLKSAMADFEH
jgi:hypothetical protein